MKCIDKGVTYIFYFFNNYILKLNEFIIKLQTSNLYIYIIIVNKYNKCTINVQKNL